MTRTFYSEVYSIALCDRQTQLHFVIHACTHAHKYLTKFLTLTVGLQYVTNDEFTAVYTVSPRKKEEAQSK